MSKPPTVPRRQRPAPEGQLTLPFPEPERPEPDLDLHTDGLVALNDAVRLILSVAEGRVAASEETTARLRGSLAVLAAHNPGGRLGHVVRRYAAQPPTDAQWDELVEELAFVLSLGPGSHAPQPAPTQGGAR